MHYPKLRDPSYHPQIKTREPGKKTSLGKLTSDLFCFHLFLIENNIFFHFAQDTLSCKNALAQYLDCDLPQRYQTQAANLQTTFKWKLRFPNLATILTANTHSFFFFLCQHVSNINILLFLHSDACKILYMILCHKRLNVL